MSSEAMRQELLTLEPALAGKQGRQAAVAAEQLFRDLGQVLDFSAAMHSSRGAASEPFLSQAPPALQLPSEELPSWFAPDAASLAAHPPVKPADSVASLSSSDLEGEDGVTEADSDDEAAPEAPKPPAATHPWGQPAYVAAVNATAARLLSHAARQGWPATADALLRLLLRNGRTFSQVQQAVSEAGGGYCLAHIAVLSGSMGMVDQVQAWATALGQAAGWDAPAGAHKLTALHLAASRRDGGQLARHLLARGPANTAAHWFAVEAADGMTPAHFARSCGADAANQQAARQLRELLLAVQQQRQRQAAPAAAAATQPASPAAVGTPRPINTTARAMSTASSEEQPPAQAQAASSTGTAGAAGSSATAGSGRSSGICTSGNARARAAEVAAARVAASNDNWQAVASSGSGSGRSAAAASPPPSLTLPLLPLLCYWLTTAVLLLAAVHLLRPACSLATRGQHGCALLILPPVLAASLAAVLCCHMFVHWLRPTSPLRQLLMHATFQRQAAPPGQPHYQDQDSPRQTAQRRAENMYSGVVLLLGPACLFAWEVACCAMGRPGLVSGDETKAMRRFVLSAAAIASGLLSAAAAGKVRKVQHDQEENNKRAAPAVMAAVGCAAAAHAAGSSAMPLLCVLCLSGCAVSMVYSSGVASGRRWFLTGRRHLLLLLHMALLLVAKGAVVALAMGNRQAVETVMLLAPLLLGSFRRHWKLQLLLWDVATTLLVTAAQHPATGLLGDNLAVKAPVVITAYCVLLCQHLLGWPEAGSKAKLA